MKAAELVKELYIIQKGDKFRDFSDIHGLDVNG
jgi:hypothetical protein